MAILTIDQPLFRASSPPVHVTHIHEEALTEKIIDELLKTAAAGVLGIAASFGVKGVLTTIAFASSSRVLHIQLTRTGAKAQARQDSEVKRPTAPRVLLRDKILCHSEYCKLGFDMHSCATALYLDHALSITQAIDLQSIMVERKAGRHSLATYLEVLGGQRTLYSEAVLDTFMGEAFHAGDIRNVSLRAWASCRVSEIPRSAQGLLLVSEIDTNAMRPECLMLLARTVRIADRLYALRPMIVKNDVQTGFGVSRTPGEIKLECSRFKTRLRKSDGSQKIVVKMQSPNGVSSAIGRAARVDGRNATLTVNRAFPSTAKIHSVVTIGKDIPTYAEDTRTRAILSILQCKSDLLENVFAQRIFLPDTVKVLPRGKKSGSAKPGEGPAIFFPARELNASQTKAVERILSEDEEDCVCLVHGPPGTGKTTVIAASVTSTVNNTPDDRCVWLLAQSNVAVKNIAEKLADIGFLDFKLIVSKDFHHDWHEHLYEAIERNVIRSDDFSEDVVGTSRLVLGSRVILATLSMMSHPRLSTCHFTRLAPPHTVIVDEASQIEIGDYLPLLYLHGQHIRKLAFIGDDKQLAPYGQDDIGELPSIFEVQQLRKNAVFLDTQYRMPLPIGNFISQHVYGGRLKTSHAESSRRSCRFVDVYHGKEQRAGNSWQNPREADVVVHLARRLHAQGKSYRVITPYDPQRNLLEERLKVAKLPWENKCFNVDSFQGNEDDHIIISVVRSDKVGFLKNVRRTNVMLSRCRKSMIICTSRAFLDNVASSTLIGKLATDWNNHGAWLNWRDILSGRF